MPKYDAVWILSSNNPDVKTLTGINVSRLEAGLEIYRSGKSRHIALSGSSSDEMLKYLTENGVAKENIHSEQLSRDTVANVVAFELTIRRLYGWKSVALVSSENHLYRINKIISSLYPGKFNVENFGVLCSGNDAEKTSDHEMASLNDFNRDFRGIIPWDDMEIIRRLADVHSAYKNRPDKNNLRSILMRAL